MPTDLPTRRPMPPTEMGCGCVLTYLILIGTIVLIWVGIITISAWVLSELGIIG